ncbi:Transcriptional regulatory protein [Enhygromyxa salina]|uniref:Transcriptional regulatory protein n=1 Tax=Enhygromyxa salina TaxID=215803 RepID=A0A0C1ZMK8_9BACT|nr:LysR family transcriptional regulator [Enhygromyxa salina]KIG12258.1 Transcriptional regulatory protein [Enhygromyxa salina]
MRQTQLTKIDLNLLVILDLLLTEENVSAAARRLRLSQSAVSRSLAKLRELFDDELFVRTGRGMRPTRRALELAAPLRRTLGDLGALLEPRERFDPLTAQRRFQIAALDYSQLTLLGPWMGRLAERAPSVDVVVRQLSVQSKRELEAGSLDVYVSPRVRSAAGVVWTPLHEDGYTCVVWSEHASRRLSLSRYVKLEHVLVAPGERPGGVVDRTLAEQGLRRRVSVQVPTFSSVPYLLVGTQRVATLPSRIAARFVEVHPLRMLEPPIELPPVALHLGWHELHRSDPGHAWLREQLIEVAREAS